MLLGEVVCIVGSVFLTKLTLDTLTVAWAAFLVVHGAGMGLAMQLPYTAVQIVLQYVCHRQLSDPSLTVLSEDDVPTGNGEWSFLIRKFIADRVLSNRRVHLATGRVGSSSPLCRRPIANAHSQGSCPCRGANHHAQLYCTRRAARDSGALSGQGHGLGCHQSGRPGAVSSGSGESPLHLEHSDIAVVDLRAGVRVCCGAMYAGDGMAECEQSRRGQEGGDSEGGQIRSEFMKARRDVLS